MTQEQVKEKVKGCYPYIYQDRREPFEMQMVGWTFFDKSGKSSSSSFYIDLEQMEAAFAIEYAIYWDFDIQHLYDLEHVVVFGDKEGRLSDVVLSYHGKFYRGTHTLHKEGNHPVVYLQPGKHGIMSNPEYFNLYVDLIECCSKKAGMDGVLIAPMFADKLTTSKELNEKTEQYIKKNYSFVPTLAYVKGREVGALLMPYAEMERQILLRLQQWIERF